MMTYTAEQIFILAKSRQVTELENITINTTFVETIGFIVHQLQTERGASCLYIASSGLRFAEQRADIISANNTIASRFNNDLMQYLEYQIDANAKQLTLISWTLVGFRQLLGLRKQVDTLQISFISCMQAYTRLINSLISLLFEIIDNSSNSKISKALASLYNLVLAKECAGQERAIGAFLIASGKQDASNHRRLIELIESQDRHFELFNQLADAEISVVWANHQGSQLQKTHSRLRSAIIAEEVIDDLNTKESDYWFEICTQRLSILWNIQCNLVEVVRKQLQVLVEHARLALEASNAALIDTDTDQLNKQTEFFDLTKPIERAFLFLAENNTETYPVKSISHLLQHQSQQIAEIESELSATKKALTERKNIERAKGLLMTKLAVNEVDAYQWMRKTAMDQNRKLIDVAENIIALHRA